MKSFLHNSTGSQTINHQFISKKINLTPFSVLRQNFLKEISICFAGHYIMQDKKVFGFQRDLKLSGETMYSKFLKKLNSKLKFLFRQSRHVTPEFGRLLCNALILPYFEYESSSWFFLFKNQFSKKLKINLFAFS